MAVIDSVVGYLKDLNETIEKFDANAIAHLANRIREAQDNDKFIFIFGNGGCVANSMHFGCDMGKGLLFENRERYKVLALTENISLITAWANDTGYEHIFWRQLQVFLHKGDLVFALSGSGNSVNVLKAVEYAKQQGNEVIAISGFDGGQLAQLADFCYVVPSNNMQVVEDAHSIILHSIFVALRDS